MTVETCQGFCVTRALSCDSLSGGTLAPCVNQILAEQKALLASPHDQSSGPAILSVEILRLGAPVFP